MRRRSWTSAGVAELIIVDAGPLIALAKADALEVAGELPLEFICPQSVRDELDAGLAKGHAEVNPTWLKVLPVAGNITPIGRKSLGRGEAAVIRLALERAIPLVCIDDWWGRRAATAVGLRVTGTLGLLVRAKALGIVPAVRPFTDRLTSSGTWFDPELVRRVLEELGE